MRGGAIVNITRVAARAIFPLPMGYPTSKAALGGLPRGLAALPGGDDIGVNAVAPGATDTPALPSDPALRGHLRSLGVLGRIAGTDELAATIVYLASDDAAFIAGQTISPNGGHVA